MNSEYKAMKIAKGHWFDYDAYPQVVKRLMDKPKGMKNEAHLLQVAQELVPMHDNLTFNKLKWKFYFEIRNNPKRYGHLRERVASGTAKKPKVVKKKRKLTKKEKAETPATLRVSAIEEERESGGQSIIATHVGTRAELMLRPIMIDGVTFIFPNNRVVIGGMELQW